ncbi:MAG: response regulator [Candidatus Omnitrophica bacterium]|nr:response regulator [Candidatus Omnitrophota bacterium]
MNILIVDDSADSREWLRVKLEMEGHNVTEAANGLEALDFLKKEVVDCVISDLLMPEMDGFSLCVQIRKNEQFKLLPFIVLTKSALSFDDEEKAKEIGVDKFFINPDSLDVVLKAIIEVTREAKYKKLRIIKPASSKFEIKEYNESIIRKLEEKNLELEKLSEKLEGEHNFLKAIIETEPECVKLLDFSGKILQINPAGLKIMKMTSPEQIVGKSVYDFVLPEYHHIYEEKLKSVFYGNTEVWEFEVVWPEGNRLHFETHAAPLRDAGGRIIACVAITRDITEKLSLEEKLIKNQQFEMVRKMSSSIAHDFNNLLTIIEGFAQLLMGDRSSDDPIYKDASEILDASARASSLTNQLLAFSQCQMMRPRDIDLNNFIQNIEHKFQGILGDKVEIEIHPGSDIGMAIADPYQMEQMFVYLAESAHQTLPISGKLIIKTSRITLDTQDAAECLKLKPGNYVLISITDTRQRVKNTTCEHIFEPVFNPNKPASGLSLRLSSCYGIARQMGGTIACYCVNNQGMTFDIYLPAAREMKKRVPLKGNETILLVDDESPIRKLASRILHEHGYVVLEASNGVEALKAAEEYIGINIDMLITDVIMPVMGGEELSEKIRVLYPEIKVLFISGYAADSIFQKIRLDSENVFLQKPFNPQTLLVKVREILDAISAQ